MKSLDVFPPFFYKKRQKTKQLSKVTSKNHKKGIRITYFNITFDELLEKALNKNNNN